MKYVTFPRPLLVAARERKGLSVALRSSGKLLAAENYPYTQHSVMSIRSYHFVQNCAEYSFRPQLPLL